MPMTPALPIRRAVRALSAGGVIAYPTEGVWGLGCDPFEAAAVADLLRLKRRAPNKGLILVAADIGQFDPYLGAISAQDRARLEAGWPGPVTWLVPHGNTLPAWLTGGRATVALRVSAHPVVAALCAAQGGPIVSTSANPSGRPPARSALRVRCYFPQGLACIVPGRLGGQRGPTEIRELHGGRLLRAG